MMSEIDWENFFRSEDFCDVDMSEPKNTCRFELADYQRERLAKEANRKLWAFLQCERAVNGDTNTGAYHGVPLSWHSVDGPNDTHTARIIDIKRISKDGNK